MSVLSRCVLGVLVLLGVAFASAPARAISNGDEIPFDGSSWVLPQNDNWRWGLVLGFTCEEAFVSVLPKGKGLGIARIRLDSLGPGLPPD